MMSRLKHYKRVALVGLPCAIAACCVGARPRQLDVAAVAALLFTVAAASDRASRLHRLGAERRAAVQLAP